MIIIGMLLMSLGTYLYISCELGCGPRDGLMVVLTKITKKPVSTITVSYTHLKTLGLVEDIYALRKKYFTLVLFIYYL